MSCTDVPAAGLFESSCPTFRCVRPTLSVLAATRAAKPTSNVYHPIDAGYVLSDLARPHVKCCQHQDPPWLFIIPAAPQRLEEGPLTAEQPPLVLDQRLFQRQKPDYIIPDSLEMSSYYWQPTVSSDEQYYDFDCPSRVSTSAESQNAFAAFGAELYTVPYEQQPRTYAEYPQAYQHLQQPPQYQIQMPTPVEQRQQQWQPGMFAPDVTSAMGRASAFPQYTDVSDFDLSLGHQSEEASLGYLSPPTNRARASRAASVTESLASSAPSTQTDFSRAVSPSATEMSRWGKRNGDNSWSCAYPGCTSKSTFHRGCDLRKHYKRHTKSLFCRHEGCPQATEGGFSSKKDRARHEAKHNPTIVCEWDGCQRLFSRQDNMKDHVRRVHKRRVQ
ncbi:hypothetical protein CERZMDRAFT_98911 [Cercospora zeae-maydis SCOH1-5]|uniref:C2H2-type domain-containing protein n=1 Tax=Cercospora zeae-maydis SCOH1-5 TaxID=717836 RepID=A0A6A6FCK1_9PEZI|nr:hypothetical protein CERZMDRAFT_98911 [Cercospora zeae-maydis SCOH1-5]